MKRIYALVVCLMTISSTYAQVGIGTTDPTEALDVNGNMRIRDLGTDAPDFSGGDRFVLTESDGTLKKSSFNTNNIDIDGGVINITVTGGGDVFYGIATETLTPSTQYDDLDFSLETTNEDVVVIRLLGPTSNFDITGIDGGSDGRHLIIANTTSNNMSFTDEDTDSAEANRILTILGNGAGKNATTGSGTAELLYSGTDQRWVLYRIN